MITGVKADLAPGKPLEIPRDIHDAMVAHCVREAPLECCGILCGNAPRVSLFYPLRNDMKSETRYNADPRELIAAHIDFRGKGAEILAIYHSHPRLAGRAEPDRFGRKPLRPRPADYRLALG